MTAGGRGGHGVTKPPVAILIGPPGAGKSTVGEALAVRLGVGFTETDADIEAVAGKPVSDIFIEDGEPFFRDLERAAVTTAIGTADGVVGLGGGSIMSTDVQRQLTGLPVVYLRASFPELAKRVGMDTPRPLLLGNPRAKLKGLLEERLPVYERLAWLTVDTDGRDPADIAEEIAGALTLAQPP